ncbi:MAG: hypothetical protein VXX85_04430 [Candidatus Margulisiibacteriota bacterium]|nr:hypothetical protein [Candidatus Margulisiibacteriota bacterium]
MYLKKVLCTTIDKNLFNNDDGIYDLSFGKSGIKPLCFGISMAFLGNFTTNDTKIYHENFIFLQYLHDESTKICKSARILDAPISVTDTVLHHSFRQKFGWELSEVEINCFESSQFRKNLKFLIALYYADQSQGHAMSAHYSSKTQQLKCFYPIYEDSKNCVHIFSSSWIDLLANKYIQEAQSYRVFYISKSKQRSTE